MSCTWCAEIAYRESVDSDGWEIPERLAIAEHWCRIGLTLNPHKRALHYLDVRLTSRTSLNDAIVKWERYVDWDFWDPFNHAELVRLYSDAGSFGKAADSLYWLEGSSYYREARQYYREAWRRELEAMEVRFGSK